MNKARLRGAICAHRHQILLVLVALVFSCGVSATPLYYTFEGAVNWVIDDAGVIVSGPEPFGFGTAVSYVWLMDTDQPGKQITSGVETNNGDFFAQLIGGQMLAPQVLLAPFDTFNSTQRFRGLIGGTASSVSNDVFVPGAQTSLGDQIYIIELRDIADVGSLTIGDDGFSVFERITIEGAASRYQVLAGGASTGLTLTSISSSNPLVPLPAAVWLFGSGLVGLLGIAMKRKRA